MTGPSVTQLHLDGKLPRGLLKGRAWNRVTGKSTQTVNKFERFLRMLAVADRGDLFGVLAPALSIEAIDALVAIGDPELGVRVAEGLVDQGKSGELQVNALYLELAAQAGEPTVADPVGVYRQLAPGMMARRVNTAAGTLTGLIASLEGADWTRLRGEALTFVRERKPVMRLGLVVEVLKGLRRVTAQPIDVDGAVRRFSNSRRLAHGAHMVLRQALRLGVCVQQYGRYRSVIEQAAGVSQAQREKHADGRPAVLGRARSLATPLKRLTGKIAKVI